MDVPFQPDANARLDRIDKAVLLTRCPLFSGLSQWEMKAIAQLTRLVEFKRGETIYREGEAAGSFYIIVSGRFEASVGPPEKRKILAYLRRGDYFGEMSLLTNQPHSATIRALSDSILLELKKEDFKRTIEHNAMIALELGRRLSVRLKGGASQSPALFKNDVICIFDNPSKRKTSVFSLNFAASLFHETHQKTIVLDFHFDASDSQTPSIRLEAFDNIEHASAETLAPYLVKQKAGFDVIHILRRDKSGDARGQDVLTHLLNHLAVEYRFIIIHLPRTTDEMSLKALTQADSVFFVTESDVADITEVKSMMVSVEKTLGLPEERCAVVVQESLLGMRTTHAIRKELFGNKICFLLPPMPAGVPDDSRLPRVLEEPDNDYSRTVRHMARRSSGNLVGLALGSGAALGLAHIGVLKVLEKERIPIDIISGSSIGSIIGALYAVGKSAAEIEAAAYELQNRLRFSQMMDFSPFPLHGLVKGKNVIRHLKNHLGNKTFEDCKIHLKIIGANLSSREAHVFESGYILDAIRTSISIPAIFKPVFMNKDVFVDGGIVSPLPVRELRRAGANKIIAVDVFPTPQNMLERRLLQEEADEKEGMAMRQRNFLTKGLFRMKKALIKRLSSNVFDILMNTIQTMESEIAEMEAQDADLLLRPVVPNADWVEFYKPAGFIKRGEEEAIRFLPKIKALVSQQNG
ncbi:MAG: patatin-like phospholipase family protein [Candidatus Omnitrophica bacterium]|nr:patatin-like phospholipase family protein [Candidatus Omnitrophota bacterium]